MTYVDAVALRPVWEFELVDGPIVRAFGLEDTLKRGLQHPRQPEKEAEL